jgi:hypothetical protein
MAQNIENEIDPKNSINVHFVVAGHPLAKQPQKITMKQGILE